MAVDIARELAALERLRVPELKQQYEAVLGERCRSNHKQWLVRRIIWRIQANAEGGLSERARQRALELANDADLRLKAPSESPLKPQPAKAPLRVIRGAVDRTDRRLPAPGTVLTRDYKGRQLRVRIEENGLEFEGERYSTLSAVAKAITGSHTNGYLFFRLGQYAGGHR